MPFSDRMEYKKISIVMCTYNGEKYLREQLNSILSQTYPVYEFIIQDDYSTDTTYSIIQEYAQKYPIIRCLQNTRRQGVNSNFFSAIKTATGDYLAISDQDDIWELDKIEIQVKAIGNNLLCSGFSKPFAEEGIPIHFDARIPNYNLLRVIYVNNLPGHTLLFSGDLLTRLPNDLSEISSIRLYDVIIVMVAMAHNSVVFINKVLVHQRRYLEAVSYYFPKNNQLTLYNVVKKIVTTMAYYKELKPEMQRRFGITLRFLKQLSPKTPIIEEAIKMAELQCSSSILSFFKLVFFCVKTKDKIFHAKETSRLLSYLRAIYFPVSCSEYYRYISKKHNR
ncbi:putative glycosyltransferase EpsE [termite gut metagenome]|uniref:Putative glycosyltransferase EpsE n=1 Tax=termite gut metagenome TaxID=433724 RepID=A0A5J4QJ86_9ZZZZ